MTPKSSSDQTPTRAGWKIICATLILAAAPGLAEAKDAKIFPTPEAAAAGMIEALQRGTNEAIEDLLGDQHNDELFTDDEAAERENRKLALAAAKDAMTLEEEEDGTRTMLIGKQEWPVPFPIVQSDQGWSFDTEAGLYELLARRIGANELAAIASLRAFVAAEQEYAEIDRDGDEVPEYAQKFVSTGGGKDGLYWQTPAESKEPASPLLSFIAQQGGYLEGRDTGDPLRGYDFRILTRQGEGAPGGRYDYVINGNMIGGFAVLATPSEYGVTGVTSFIVSHLGKIYEQDLGDDTDKKAAAIQEYNLDPAWQLLKE